MHSSLFIAALSGFALVRAQQSFVPIPGTTGELGDAEEVKGNPPGVTYQAILPDSKKSTIRGYVAGTSSPDGKGVDFNVNIYGLPDKSLGPFRELIMFPFVALNYATLQVEKNVLTMWATLTEYHIHDQPVPADGNCTGTKAHLDPYIRGQEIPCDPEDPASCQVGDLSGKHGNITRSPFQVTYRDLYLSTKSGPASFFGNRSIVIHSNNSSRLTCANFTLVAGNHTAGNGTTSSNHTKAGGASPSASTAAYLGGATSNVISTGAILAGLAALLL